MPDHKNSDSESISPRDHSDCAASNENSGRTDYAGAASGPDQSASQFRSSFSHLANTPEGPFPPPTLPQPHSQVAMTAHHLPSSPGISPESAERESPPTVPAATVGRLGLYLRELQMLKRADVTTVKSQLLGQRLELSDSQIRRDLALFGHFGRRGVGYHVDDLIQSIRRILGGDRAWRVVLIGMGNLGSALARYHGFVEQGFRLVAAFDNAPAKVGQSTSGIPVYDLEQLESIVAQHGVEMAILAVPSESAQSLVPRLAACGITGILNFAPVTLRLPPTVTGVEVDLAMELQRLAFAVASRNPQS